MSYQPQPLTPIPDETSRVAQAAFPTGNLVMQLRDELAGLYTDQDFADLFPARGQAAECPWRLAVVTILQFLEGLTDRQAAEAVRSRIDWKYLLGLELTDTGFHFTVLHAFRARLIAGHAEQRLLMIMLERLQQAVRLAPAIDILRQVWVQQYYGPEEPVRWRTGNDIPPAECLIHSPYDTEARYSIKRGHPWLGYKVHLTETCDDDAPHLITQVETTPATVQDDAVTDRIQDELSTRGLPPAVHLVDAGYTTAGHLVTSRDEHGIDLVGPVAASAGWQARAGTGFDLDHFAIDWDG
ncbi:MAG: transposase, partial [Chloroflexota bacterium]|nr:transposase [Chloroflexota bacterium]